MALGMKNPSHWAPTQQFQKAAERRTLAPISAWTLKAGGLTDRSLKIESDAKDVLYTTHSHSPLKGAPYVTLHMGDNDSKDSAAAGAILDAKEGFHICLGDPSATSGGVVGGAEQQRVEVRLGGNIRCLEHRFSPPAEQKDYAWRDTQQYEISIADSEVETSGRDWKFISLTPNGEEDELLAVFVHSPKANLRHKSQMFWFQGVESELELWALAVAAGLIERGRRSKDKFNFSAMVGAGVVM